MKRNRIRRNGTRSNRIRSNKIKKAVLGFAALALLAVLALLFIREAANRKIPEDSEPSEEVIAEKPEEPEKPEEEEEPDTSESDVEEVVYPAPEFAFQTEEISVEIAGLEKEYTIAFVNDLHMITDHSSGDVTEDNMPVVRERYETLAVTEDGVYAEELWPEIIKYLNYYDFDAVIFGGDMLDYCSNSNIDALKSGMNELKYPADRIMYIRSDHDYGGWYGGSGFTDSDGFLLQSFVLDSDKTEKLIEFDEFMVVGINQSYRGISEDAYEVITENLERGKPVLIATHVPFYSEEDESLEALSMEVRNKIYYWSDDSSHYVPEGQTQMLIDRMYAGDSNVVQILAAHMHAPWDGYVTDRLKEHIFTPAFQGSIGIIHVTGGEKKQNESEIGEME